MINGGACNVYWQVGSSATLGTGSDFEGHVLAQASVTLDTDASIEHGSAIALSGAVTMDTNDISTCATPEPAPIAALALGLLGVIFRRRSVR